MIEKLSWNNLLKLMLYLHSSIEESVDGTIDSINTGKKDDPIVYPPNTELDETELTILKKIFSDKKIMKVMRKIMIDCAMYPLFNLFNIIDGTVDIPDADYEAVEIIQCSYDYYDDQDGLNDQGEFMHDYFFDTYWIWKENQENN